MQEELSIWLRDKTVYSSRALCDRLEPNFSDVFAKIIQGEATLDEHGQIIWKIGNRVLAGLYQMPLEWSNDALTLPRNSRRELPKSAIVLVKNPNKILISPRENAWSGEVNGIVLLGDTLWCAQVGRRNEATIIRRVIDLSGAEYDFQGELKKSLLQIMARPFVDIPPWNPPPRTW